MTYGQKPLKCGLDSIWTSMPNISVTPNENTDNQIERKKTYFYEKTLNFFNEAEEVKKMKEQMEQKGVISLPMSSFKFQDYKNLIAKGLQKDAPNLLPLLDFMQDEFNKCIKKVHMVNRKASPGIAYRPYPWPLKLQQLISTNKINNDANYTSPNGPPEAINAISVLEGMKLGDAEAYPRNGIFFVNGGSNGIHNIVSYVKKQAEDTNKNQIVSCGPAYIQFIRNTEESKVPLDVVLNDETKDPKTKLVRFLPTPEQIQESITGNTSTLVITQPNNPTGEFYSEQELQNIVEIAKEYDLLLVDDAAFEELVFPENVDSFKSVAEVAHKMGELDRVVTIKSFSKGKNFPGSRIGMMITSNEELIEYLSTYVFSQRDSHALNYNDIICLDAILSAIEMEYKKDPQRNVEEIIDDVLPQFTALGADQNIDVPINKEIVEAYIMQRNEDMQAYQNSFELVTSSPLFQTISSTRAAYNTIVRLSDYPEHIPLLDFALQLYQQEGIETEWGPNYGIIQEPWEKESNPWLRLTFSSDKKYLDDCFKRLREFVDRLR